MSSRIYRFVVMLAAVATTRESPAQPAPGGPCPRPPARALAAVVIIRGAPLCRMVFRPTGITLRSDAPGVHPDPGDHVVMDARGRFYTNASGILATIAAWGPNGAFLKSIGRPGQGPGEFSDRGGLVTFVDSRNRLHVRDGSQQWSIFSPDMTFVARASSLEMGGVPGRTIVLDNGTVLSTSWKTRNRPLYFHVANLEGVELSAFGPVPKEIQEATRNNPARVIAYAGGGEFVAAPPGEVSGSYDLEVWSVQGKQIRTFRREVPWFPPGQPGKPRGPTSPPFPSFRMLHLDSTGVLLATVVVPNAAWRFVPSPESGRPMRSTPEMEDVWLEAIDTRSGTLLASTKMSSAAAEDSLPRFIPRGNLTAKKHDETNDVFVEILRYDFVFAPPVRGRERVP